MRLPTTDSELNYYPELLFNHIRGEFFMQKEMDVSAGKNVIQQDEVGQGFFILKSGSLEVLKDDVLLSVLMFPGTIFGEMGDILGKPRTCTVRAKTDTKVLHVSDGDLESLIRESPEIALKIIKTLATRLDRTTQKLASATKESTIWSVKG